MSRFAQASVLLLLVFCAGLTVSAASPRPTQPPDSPHARWLAEQLADPGHFVPGPDLAALPTASTMAPASPDTPAYLEDHNRLAYQALITNTANGYITHHWEIYFSDGSDSWRITDTERTVHNVYPRLSNGAQRIVYASTRESSTYQLYTMNTDGSGRSRLTSGSSDQTYPDWSPDGSSIVYQSYDDGQSEIYRINQDGSGRTRLTDSPSYDGMPVWSPDGQRIAFISTRTGQPQIFLMNVDGTGLQHLATGVDAFYPVWYRDGTRLAFSGDQGGDGWYELWTIGADGSDQTLGWNPGPGRDALPRSHYQQGSLGWLALTTVDWIFHEGDWYWTAAQIQEWTEASQGAPPSNLLYDIWPLWHPEVKSIDTISPVMPDSLRIGRLHQNRFEAYTAEATDAGGSGLSGYDLQMRTYPAGDWINLKQREQGSYIIYEAPAGIDYLFRMRAWDLAGNVSDWVYGGPAAIYNVRLDSLITDHRAVPLNGAGLVSDLRPFVMSQTAHGRFDSYFAVDNAGHFQAGWQRWGYGAVPLTRFEGHRPQQAIHAVLPPARNLVEDASFESGVFDPWQLTGSGTYYFAEYSAHLGYRSLVLLSSPEGETSAELPVAIPANMDAPTLSFFTWLPEMGGIKLTVRVTTAGQTTTLLTHNGRTVDEWQHYWKDMTPWAGKNVTLSFTIPAMEGGFLAVDDVTLGDCGPDLWVSPGNAAAALPGEAADLTISYGNAGQKPSDSATLTATLPAGLTFLSASPAPTSLDPLRWDVGTLAASQQGAVRLLVRIASRTVPRSTLLAQAVIASPSETLTSNNEVSLPVYAGARVMAPLLNR